jgi:hypothetical protein
MMLKGELVHRESQKAFAMAELCFPDEAECGLNAPV